MTAQVPECRNAAPPAPDEALLASRFAGCLLGTAVGDAIGLPRERLSPRRARRLFGGPPLGHRLVFGRGMVSDDTEHQCIAAQALIESGGDMQRFARSLARRLRWWLVGLILPVSAGKATVRSIRRLWLGVPPERSGVPSTGNGPAMRAAALGLYAGRDRQLLAALVRASTRMTHSDPRCEQGALAVARAAAYAVERGPDVAPDHFLDELLPDLIDADLKSLLERARVHLRRSDSVEQYVDTLGLRDGVPGHIHPTVAVALYCWLRHPADCRAAVEAAVLAGGDTDSVGAIAGALVGATVGEAAIPPAWRRGLLEWPRSVEWIRGLGTRLAEAAVARSAGDSAPRRPPSLFWPAVLPRNVFFLLVVFLHALRRLLPPY